MGEERTADVKHEGNRLAPQFRLSPFDQVRVDELAALGFTIEFGTHNCIVWEKGTMRYAVGVGYWRDPDPEYWFEKALYCCWHTINEKRK